MLSKEFRWIIEDLNKIRLDGVLSAGITVCAYAFTVAGIFYTLFLTLGTDRVQYFGFMIMYLILGFIVIIITELKMKSMKKKFSDNMKRYEQLDKDFREDMEKIEELSKVKKKTTKKKTRRKTEG